MVRVARASIPSFAALWLMASATPGIAADWPVMPVKAPIAAAGFDWSGWYVGGHVGFTRGESNWSAAPTGVGAPVNGAFDLPFHFDVMAGTGSYVAGLQAGYNYVSRSRVLLGVEADLTFPNSDVLVPYSVRGSQLVATSLLGAVSYGEAVIHYGSARARVGYVFDQFLLYGTAGFAWTYDQVTRTQVAGTSPNGSATPGTVDNALLWRFGWAAGAGIELPIDKNWSAKAEYLATGFGRKGAVFPAGAEGYAADLTLQSIRFGLNYHLGDTSRLPDLLIKGPTALETDWFAVHGQFTYTNQYAPRFRAPYSGPNSLDGGIGRETADLTLFAGIRLWQGAEAWINPEIDQGLGLSSSLGAAGFPSAEAYKVGADYPYLRLHRAFLRQTINLGGEVQQLDAGPNQFSGSQTSDRLVFTVGKFSVGDVFDTNRYAHDPRSDFLNWAIVDTGTFDYAADAWAYSVGATAEWYQGPWTLRFGLFDLSIAPNQTALDSRFEQFQWIGELERRYTILDQPGKVAVTGFLTRGRMGSFADAIQLAMVTGGPADITAVRRYASRGGISMNLEQQLVPNVGLFVRAGIADGRREPYEFTDIDRTVAAGLSLSGKQWGRDGDTFGIAGVVNGITTVHQAFLNAGGLGILVGDGMLPNPGSEKIIEAYYSFPVFAAKLTLDYQYIVNPAYNRDRGPVSVLGARFHSQF
ncbi:MULTISPECIES: carbohydrate porin [unclassified Bradyrhizobium]|uniref:carbohydrate porin n=2 Tax=Bradyrhizobium TaxID=374 RepID=UPI002011167D|nr:MULTISPECIES: carbohydrate porin [unclassified Bradyrhizobium]